MATMETESQRALANDLKARLCGPVLRKGDAGYDDARAVWNAMIDKRPPVIARCLGVADVVAALEAARTGASQTLRMPPARVGRSVHIRGTSTSSGTANIIVSAWTVKWGIPSRARLRRRRRQTGCGRPYAKGGFGNNDARLRRQRQHPLRLRLRSDSLRRTGRPSEARNSSGQRTTTIDLRR